jgi:branched chain amino acid efflux pump
MRPGLVLTFAAMGVATYLTRAPLLLLLARRRLPGWLERYFAALPIALLTALALPLLVLAGGRPAPWDPQVPGALLVAWLARRTGNLLLAVAAGVVLVALLRAVGS